MTVVPPPIKSIIADAHKVVDRAERANLGIVTDQHVSAKRGGVGHDDVISDHTVVRDVTVGHDQAMAAEAGYTAAFDGAATDRDKFADLVVIANFKTCGLACISKVLRRHSDRGEREKCITRPNFGRAFHRDMRPQPTVFAKFNIRSNHTVRTDLARGMDLGGWIDNRCGMNAHAMRILFFAAPGRCLPARTIDQAAAHVRFSH